MEVLGFKLDQLTQALCKKWSLGGGLLEESFIPASTDTRIRLIRLSHEYAHMMAKNPHHADIPMMLKRFSALLEKPVESLSETIRTATEKAAEVAHTFGLPELQESATLANVCYLKPNPSLQESIFREIAELQKKETDMNVLFEMLTEGIQRGIGMDRTMFATLTAEQTLKSKIILSQDPNSNDAPLEISLLSLPKNYFHHTLECNMPLYFPENLPLDTAALRTPFILDMFGEAGVFMMPVNIQNKPIGIFTADRRFSGRLLSDDDFTVFKNFVMQANVYFTRLKRRRS